MRFIGPSTGAIRGAYSLVADMPRVERELCDEVDRLRGELMKIATFSRQDAPMMVARSIAHAALYPQYVENDLGGRR